jgi:hypothetical protein
VEPDYRIKTGAFTDWSCKCGRRRAYCLTLLGDAGIYPQESFRASTALYVANSTRAYTVVPAEPANEFGWSEIAWANLGEIKLWGALAFATREGEGYFRFVPIAHQSLWLSGLDEQTIEKTAQRLASTEQTQQHDLQSIELPPFELQRLYAALSQADVVLLRGVNCFLKAQLVRSDYLLMEEMAINLHVSLEAGLLSLRRKLAGGGRVISLEKAYQFIEGNFTHGKALVEFWTDRRFDRNMLLHPVSELGGHVIPPMSVDDVWELVHPMHSLYRFLLLDAMRPTFDKWGRPVEGTGR